MMDVLKYEYHLYFNNKKDYLKALILNSNKLKIWKYIVLLRKAEYHRNMINNPLHLFMFIIYRRKKNRLGRKIGFDIPEGCFKKGLHIYHIGPVIVNANSRIGENCIIVGNTCLGNVNGRNVGPQIGDNCMIGWGGAVIGPVHIGNNCKIGAGATVVKSYPQNNATLIGTPAILKSTKGK